MKKVNITSISNKIKFIYGDECEKNTVGIVIFTDGTDYFFDAEYKNEMSNEEVEALLLRGAAIFRDGKYYRPNSFNNENVSFGGGSVVDPDDIEVDLSDYVTKEYVDSEFSTKVDNANSNTVNGFSIISPEWLNGTLYSGSFSNTKNRITQRYTFIEPTKKMAILLDDATKYRFAVHQYDLSGKWIKDTGWMSTRSYEVEYDPNLKYRIVFGYNDDTTIDVSETKHIIVVEYNTIKESHIINDIARQIRHVGITGQMGLVPSNSLEAIRLSKLKGAYGVELDVRLTADNIPVLLHSDLIDGILDGPANTSVGALTLTELQQFKRIDANTDRFGYNITLTTLEEAAIECRKLGLCIWLDIKHDGDVKEKQIELIDQIINVMKKTGMSKHCVYVSESGCLDNLIYISKKTDSVVSIKFYSNSDSSINNMINNARKIEANILIQPEAVLTKEQIELLHYNNFFVRDTDYMFVFEKEIPDRIQTRYRYKLTTTDGGTTWNYNGVPLDTTDLNGGSTTYHKIPSEFSDSGYADSCNPSILFYNTMFRFNGMYYSGEGFLFVSPSNLPTNSSVTVEIAF